MDELDRWTGKAEEEKRRRVEGRANTHKSSGGNMVATVVVKRVGGGLLFRLVKRRFVMREWFKGRGGGEGQERRQEY